MYGLHGGYSGEFSRKKIGDNFEPAKARERAAGAAVALCTGVLRHRPLRLSIWCLQRTPTRHTTTWSSVIPSETEFSPVHPHPVYPGIVRRPAAVQSPQQRPPATHSMVTGSEGRSAALRSAVGTYQSSHFVPLPRSEAPSHLHPGHRKRTTTITPAFAIVPESPVFVPRPPLLCASMREHAREHARACTPAPETTRTTSMR